MLCQSNTSLFYLQNWICFNLIHIDNGVFNKYNSIVNKWIYLYPFIFILVIWVLYFNYDLITSLNNFKYFLLKI